MGGSSDRVMDSPSALSHQGHRLLRGVVSLASHSRADWKWWSWGVRMKGDLGCEVVCDKVAHVQWTPAQPQRPVLFPSPRSPAEEQSGVSVHCTPWGTIHWAEMEPLQF